MKTRKQVGVVERITPALPHMRICMHVLHKARTHFKVLRDAEALVAAGFDVTIVDIESDRTLPIDEEFHGILLKHIIMPAWHRRAYFKPWFIVKLLMATIHSAVCMVRSEADIYHVHSERALPACYIAARLRRKPYIIDTPELTLSDPSIARWPRLRSLAIQIIRLMVAQSAGYVTGSPYYPEELRYLYDVPEVTVVRHVPPYQEVSKSNLLRQSLDLAPEVRIALYQGNIQPNRRLDLLVRAVRYLEQDIVIVLMGLGQRKTLSELHSLIAHEGVEERVRILPPVPYEELLHWTGSADIGLTIFPPDYSMSIRKCLPNKFFEYLMAGVPVLTAPLDAIIEMVNTYDVGQVISSLEPIAIGTAINTMLNDQEGLQRMSDNAIRAARNEFYWEKESQALVRLFNEALTKSSLRKWHEIRK